MRIVKFIGLKIVEIAGALLILYLCNFYHNFIISALNYPPEIVFKYHWLIRGLFGLVLLAGTAIPVYLIYLLVKKNWEWAGEK